MYLTKVELAGFKSFPNRTSFEFDKGITAVLGPNGCGKSNVVDAVKWVLGESSPKKLRGSQMLDVIFNGSERRKPLGCAEVSLFFNNEDGSLPVEYNEVSVTRRLYRSGESEYLINNNPCRRRDIRELFMDTGIGTSAYSFIEQGKVEALLDAKPAERRMVFEEAAGISKYKARRKETLARLERTNQYLLRVNDIVDEIDKNVRRVSRQAASAKRYQRLKEELDALKTHHYTRQFLALSEQLEKVFAEQKEIGELFVAESGKEASFGQAVAELTQQEITAAQQAQNQERAALTLQENLGQVLAELSGTTERLASMDREEKDAGERAEALRSRIAEIAREYEGAVAGIEAARAEAETALQNTQSLEAERARWQAGAQESENEIGKSRAQLRQIGDRRNSLIADSARAESEENNLNAREQQLHEQDGNRSEELSRLEEAVKALEQEGQSVADEALKLNERVSAHRTNEKHQRERIQGCGDKVSSLRNEQSAKAARRSTLEDLEHNFAGAFQGVKSILTAKQEGRRDCAEVRGMVADLITVPTDVALAIETVLGGQAQDIVVDSARGAQDCIEYLKANRAGRATFLPLDRIRSRERLRNDLRHIPGVLGEAVDLVQFDPVYRAAMEYLMAGVLIVDSLELARDLAKQDARGIRIVTLEGEVINPYGAMTGGNGQKGPGGIITRKAEMDQLADELSRIKEQLNKLEVARMEAIQLANAEADQAKAVEAQLAEVMRGAQRIERDLSVRKSELARLHSDREGLEQELARIRDSRENLAGRRAGFSRQREELDIEEKQLEEALAALIEKQQGAREELDQLNERLAVARETRAQKQAFFSELERRVATLLHDREQRERELENCLHFSTRAVEERASLKERFVQLQAKETELSAQRDEARGSGDSIRQQLAEIRQRLSEARDHERALQRRLSEINEASNSLKIRESECRMKIENVEQKAREDLEISDLAARAQIMQREEAERAASREAAAVSGETVANPEPEVPHAAEISEFLTNDGNPLPFMTDKQVSLMIEDVSGKIAKIGPVNMYAIDELAELEARAEFLQSEKEDLDKAAQDLLAVIDRLNVECGKKFEETFTTVRENFQEMFRKLFGGGKADLVLEEADDALDAGIDIVARPPGKEPTSISLLSGGEKALCAVALLFAIFRSKPSPFCILDEVDGPLDESNIDRFMSAVREFSVETQFILISHSKRTMGMTDTIYGVTQDEPGVSRKYSLRFTEMEKAGREDIEAPAAEPLAVG
jgi:chromosome segregation protein